MAPLNTIAGSLTADKLLRLVDELAANIRRPLDIWKDYGINDATTARAILSSPHVMRMYREARTRWNSVENVEERIKVRSRTAVEASILPMYEAAVNPEETLSGRVKAVELLTRLGGLEKKSEGGLIGAGNTVSIRIDLSTGQADDRVVVIEGQRDAGGAEHGASSQSRRGALDLDGTAGVDLTLQRGGYPLESVGSGEDDYDDELEEDEA